MASLEGLKQRLKQWKPKVVSSYVVYTPPRKSPVPPEQVDESFTMVTVSSPDDPLLPKITSSKRQLQIARKALAAGNWDILVALGEDGEPAGRIWESVATIKELANGVPRFRLAPDEVVMFDLFVERKYRRSGIASTMADAFFKKYDPDLGQIKYAYGFIAYENAPSILWHHGVGFQIAQTVNYVEIGPFIKWKIPFSDMPRFGPLSKKGRHTDPDREMFGPPLFP